MKVKLIFSYLICCTVALKPVVDFSWNVHFPMLQHQLNLQSILGFIFFASGFWYCIMVLSGNISSRRQKFFAGIFLLAVADIIFISIRYKPNLEFAFKYGASIGGLVLIPRAIDFIRRNGRAFPSGLLVFSLVVVFVSLVLQFVKILPWQVYDAIPYFPDPIHNPTYFECQKIGRLTGFYYHPLDLMRVVVWAHLALLYLLLKSGSSKIQNVVLFLMLFSSQFLLFRTTHRSSLLFCIFAVFLFMFYFRNWIRSSMALIVIVLAWAVSIWTYSIDSKIDLSNVFSRIQLIDMSNRGDFFGVSIMDYFSMNKLAKASIARGRSKIWREHLERISHFSFTELTLGSSPVFAADKEPEPHNQLLDTIERFGLIGVLLFSILYVMVFFAAEASAFWKILTVSTFLSYGMITEILVTPTFTFWGVLFLYLPLIHVAFSDLSAKNRSLVLPV